MLLLRRRFSPEGALTSRDYVINHLEQTHERETHAKAPKAADVGDKGRRRCLLVFKDFRYERIANVNVDDGQIFPRVFESRVLEASQGLGIFEAANATVRGLVANRIIGIFAYFRTNLRESLIQEFPFVARASFFEPRDDEAKFLSMSERRSIGKVGTRDAHRIRLIVARGQTRVFALVDLIGLAQLAKVLFHASELSPRANIFAFAYLVKRRQTRALVVDEAVNGLEQAIAKLVTEIRFGNVGQFEFSVGVTVAFFG